MNSQVKLWLDHPVTQCYIRLIKEHRDGCIDKMLNSGVLTTEKLPELGQLKGQINAFDLMLSEDQLEVFFEGEIVTTDR